MKIFFKTIIVLLLINLSFAQTNYYVNNSLGNDVIGNGSGPGASAWKTIEYAVNNVPNPSVDEIIINISSDVYDLSNDQIDINRNFINLTLVGDGSDNTFIQSAADTSLSNSRVVKVYSGNTVSIKKLTIRYGRFKGSTNSNDGGGGILNSGGTLKIDSCKITENSGKWSEKGIGGGISNYGGNLTIRNSTISHNTGARGDYLGFGAQGGGIGSTNGTLSVYNSTIESNYALVTGGGIAVLSSGGNAIFNIENSTVYGNIAKSYGGIRIVILGYPSGFGIETNINSCTIFNNLATDVYGGLGLSTPSNLNIKNSIVAGNYSVPYGPSDLTGSTASIKITSGGYNIIQTVSNVTIEGETTNGIGKDPGLSALADNNTTNGTQTCAILPGSPAIDAIPGGNGAPSKDQRGYQRFWNYDIGAYEYTPPFATVNAKVFLEGPYNGSNMNTSLNSGEYLPILEPYNTSPWNYAGLESLAAGFFTTHTNIVDWVLVELRSTYNGTSLGRRAAFLTSDGTIVDTTGSSPVLFNGISEGNYYIVIRHRNHLAVMSKDSVALSGSSSLYDFTTAQDQAYGTNPMKALDGGGFGMIAGDANSDGLVTSTDFNIFNPKFTSAASGYEYSDWNLDGSVTSTDFNYFNPSFTSAKQSYVP